MVGAISGNYYNPYYYSCGVQGSASARSVSAGKSAVIAAVPSAQPDTPVQPVSGVYPVPSVSLDVEALLRQMENDPVEIAVRSRIEFMGEEDSPDNELINGAEEDESPEINIIGDGRKSDSAREVFEDAECETCKKRKYQDGSDDMGVSYKTPTHIAPESAASAVRGHEYEHVFREQAKAERDGREVVAQSVTYSTGICPECGRVYISGGETTTVTAPVSEEQYYSDEEKPAQSFSIAA